MPHATTLPPPTPGLPFSLSRVSHANRTSLNGRQKRLGAASCCLQSSRAVSWQGAGWSKAIPSKRSCIITNVKVFDHDVPFLPKDIQLPKRLQQLSLPAGLQLPTPSSVQLQLPKQVQVLLPSSLPASLRPPSDPSGWAVLAGVMVGAFGLARAALALLAQRSKAARAAADHTHLRSLASMAAAAGPASVVAVPGSLLGGALAEVQAHARQLDSFKLEVELLVADAAAESARLAASLQEREQELALALQTAECLEAELAEVGSLLAGQEAALAALTQQAEAAAAAHRSSLSVSQRKVALLEGMVVALRARLGEQQGGQGPAAGVLSSSAAELSAVQASRAELAGQVEALRQQLDTAQARLSAAEARSHELEGQLAALAAAKEAMGGRLAAIEQEAAAAAAAAKQAVSAAERRLAAMAPPTRPTTAAGRKAAARSEAAGRDVGGSAAVSALQESVQQREVELTVLLSQLQAAQAGPAGDTADSEAAAPQQEQSTLPLSAAVAAKAVELEEMKHQLQQQLEQARLHATAHQAEQAAQLQDISNQLAAAAAAAEAKRASVAALRDGLSQLFTGLLGALEAAGAASGAAASSGAKAAAAQQSSKEQQAAPAKPAAAAAADLNLPPPQQQQQQQQRPAGNSAGKASAVMSLKEQLGQVETSAASLLQDLELLLSTARLSLAPGLQARAAELEVTSQTATEAATAAAMSPDSSKQQRQLRQQQQQLADELLLLLRSHMSTEERSREAALRRELAALQQQADSVKQQLHRLDPPPRPQHLPPRPPPAAAVLAAAVAEQAVPAAEALMKQAVGVVKSVADAAMRNSSSWAAAASQQQQQQPGQASAAEPASTADMQPAAQQEQQSFQQQQQQQQVADGSPGGVRSQLRVLSTLQSQLDQQGAALAAMRYRYEEVLAGAAARVVEATGDVAEISGQLAGLQSSLEARAADVLDLKAAAQATNVSRAEVAAQQALDQAAGAAPADGGKGEAAQEQPVGSQAPGSTNAASSSSSASSSGPVLSMPTAGSSNAAVLFVGEAPAAASSTGQDQQQPPGSSVGPAGGVFDGEGELQDEVLRLAQKLLEEGMGPGATSASATSTRGASRGPQPAGSRAPAAASATAAVVVTESRPASPAAAAAAAAAAPAALRPPRSGLLRLKAAGVTIPHPAKAATGGEDAFFVSGAGCGCIGVADGVGGWSEEGVDAAAYAGGLMDVACDVCEAAGGSEGPLEVLTHAQSVVDAPGSCTALVAVLRPSRQLEVCLVGDTGLRVVREGGVVFASEVQEHSFNTPFQLANLDFLSVADTAESGLTYTLSLCPGDVVVAGSDGLFDNLWDDQLAEIVTQGIRSLPPSSGSWGSAAASHLARQIADVAARHSADTQFKSPWAVEVSERMPQGLSLMSRLFGPRGGKQDDITVVVGLIT